MRLLIVDDSALIRKVTHLAFPEKKYELEEADNGYGALAQLSLAQQPFDVIVLDLQMPELTAWSSFGRSASDRCISTRRS